MSHARIDEEKQLRALNAHLASLTEAVTIYTDHLRKLTYLETTGASTEEIKKKRDEVIHDKTEILALLTSTPPTIA